MHYCVFVFFNPSEGSAPEAQIEAALQPSFEKEWDWYELGGRWSSYLDNGYCLGPTSLLTETQIPCAICLEDGSWYPSEFFGGRAFHPNPDFLSVLADAKRDYEMVAIIDCHN